VSFRQPYTLQRPQYAVDRQANAGAEPLIPNGHI